MGFTGQQLLELFVFMIVLFSPFLNICYISKKTTNHKRQAVIWIVGAFLQSLFLALLIIAILIVRSGIQLGDGFGTFVVGWIVLIVCISPVMNIAFAIQNAKTRIQRIVIGIVGVGIYLSLGLTQN
jgi:hypothetical protein